MIIKILHNQDGVKISELVAYLQTQYLDRGLDGEVWIANTDNPSLTNQMAEAALLDQDSVCFDIRRDDPNPCIEFYRKDKKEPRYLDAATVEFIEGMRK